MGFECFIFDLWKGKKVQRLEVVKREVLSTGAEIDQPH